MSDNSKPTQNGSVSFEQWLGKAERLDTGATYGPWQAISTGDKGNTFIEAAYVDVLNHDEMGHGHLRHEYAWMTKEDADWIAWSRTALPQAVAALRAVADLHQPDDGGHCTECIIGHDGDSFTAGAPVHDAWPCATITAIQDTLGDHQ